MPPKKPAPAPKEPERTSMISAHQPTGEAFIGHEAPTRVGIDLAKLKDAHERTSTAPVLAPDDVTPPPQDELLTLEALEALGGQQLPARLRRFFQSEATRHEQRYHPSLGGAALHFRPAALTDAWAAAKDSAQPALLLVPIATAGLLPALLAVEVSSAALPVYRHEPETGFTLLSPTFDAWIEALTDEPASATFGIG